MQAENKVFCCLQASYQGNKPIAAVGGIPWHQEPLGCWSLVAPVVQGSCVGQSPPVGQPTTAFFRQANGRRHHPTLRGFKQAEILLGFFQKATVRRHHHVAECIRAQVWLWQLALLRRGRISSGDEHVSRAVGALAVSQPALNNIMDQLTQLHNCREQRIPGPCTVTPPPLQLPPMD